MQGRSKKFPRKKNQTDEFLDGSFDDDESQRHESFGDRDKNQQQRKTERTARLRSTGAAAEDIETLPVGQVVQVHSLFYQVEHETGNRLCVARKTLSKLADTAIVVGDLVRFRDAITDEVKALAELTALEQGQVLTEGQRQAVIEQVLPRRTVLTRADSFTGLGAQPIVANAEQMLIVVAVAQPSMSFAPMSIVISLTSDRWAEMNASAAASCEPCGYVQGEPAPVSMDVLVSPGQPSFTSVSARPNSRW